MLLKNFRNLKNEKTNNLKFKYLYVKFRFQKNPLSKFYKISIDLIF